MLLPASGQIITIKETEMPNSPIKIATIFLVILTALLLWGCSGTSAAPQTTVIVTVVETVPVEVTRLVEVTQEVIVTEIVEVPVTVTPQPATATPVPPSPTDTPTTTSSTAYPTLSPFLQITPKERGNGWLPFFVENHTSDKLDVYVSGPIPFNRTLWKGDVQKVWLREGLYTFSVWYEGGLKYNGTFNITNIDKHKLLLRDDKAKFWIP